MRLRGDSFRGARPADTQSLGPQFEQRWREEALGKRRRIAVDVGSLLREMHAGGVRFKGGRLAVQDVLDEIAG